MASRNSCDRGHRGRVMIDSEAGHRDNNAPSIALPTVRESPSTSSEDAVCAERATPSEAGPVSSDRLSMFVRRYASITKLFGVRRCVHVRRFGAFVPAGSGAAKLVHGGLLFLP